ncbi:hypothetical protein AKJ16_DCAP04869 [Drosera capensis]
MEDEAYGSRSVGSGFPVRCLSGWLSAAVVEEPYPNIGYSSAIRLSFRSACVTCLSVPSLGTALIFGEGLLPRSWYASFRSLELTLVAPKFGASRRGQDLIGLDRCPYLKLIETLMLGWMWNP